MNENGFVRRVAGRMPYYSCRAFEELPDVRHGFSTRHGGVSALPDRALNLSHVSWDPLECVEENRRRFLSALQLQSQQLFVLRQVHSDRVHIIKEVSGHWNRPEGDALATDLEGAALAVQTADCFPILIADTRTPAIAAVHTGWRGTLARLVLKTVHAMRDSLACDPARLFVAIGPGIRSCCFEVDSEVVEMFRDRHRGLPLAVERIHRPGKYLIDLVGALSAQCEEAAIPSGNIYDLGICTRCHAGEFFSYRAEGPRSGRMMGVIARVS